MRIASVQLVAVKTLTSILSTGRFKELLLVPRATLQSDGSQEKSLLEGQYMYSVRMIVDKIKRIVKLKLVK